MSDKQSKKSDDQPTVRKRVQIIEEIVEEKPSEEQAAEESSDAEGKYTVEHKAGSKVRVARATDDLEKPEAPNADEATADKRPRRRAVDMTKKPAKGDGQKSKGKGQKGNGQQPPKPRAQSKPKLEVQSRPEPDVTTADFEALLAGEAGATAAPKQAEIAPGDRIKGTVITVGEKFVFVEIGSSKIEGVANREDYQSEEGELEVAPGDELEFYVLSTSADEIRLGKKLGGREGAMEAIEQAHATGVPIQGRVVDTNKGGYEVEIAGVRAFCPISQIELGYTEEPQVHVGATYRFRVEKVDEGGRNVVVSRSALLEEEQAARRQETLESLKEGAVVTGKVTRVVDFGAFVDIGGVEGLVHVSELAHGYFDKPKDVVSEGDTVEVKILNIEQQRNGDLRIGLSRKATEGNPWDEVNKKFSVGQHVEGEVVRLAPFGAFVEISPGVDGLVHVSEMSWKEHVKHPRDVVSPGDRIMVEIQDIDMARQRISLSMKGVEGDPWDSAAERYPTGSEVTGTVENVEDFGAFVRLDSGITALIPRSEMELPSGVTPHRKYAVGSEATVRVLNVDSAARKMALTEKAAGDIQQTARPEKSQKSQPSQSAGSRSFTDDSGGGFGTLGDLLGDKLKKD